MPLITADNIGKTYADRVLFSGLNFSLDKGDKIGIVGINGTGKSTLLKLIAGHEVPTEGRFIRQNNLKIEYLPQIPVFKQGQTVLEAVFSQPAQAVKIVRQYEQALIEAVDSNNPGAQSRLMEAISAMDRAAAWDLEQNARIMLTKLGIDDFRQQVSTLSGGQQKRAALASALLQEADLLILDEPTNHLDHIALNWLEKYLESYRGSVLMVTHDRYFLDKTTRIMFELENQSLFRYDANYSAYLERKAEREDAAAIQEKKRQNQLRQELAWVRRGAKARSTKQKARLDRYRQLASQEALKSADQVELINTSARMGKETVTISDAGVKIADKWLFKDFTYIIRRDERLAIIGRNGCGKTTLLRVIAGLQTPDTGSVSHGSTVRIATFSQTAPQLDSEMRVIEFIRETAENIETSEGKLSASQMLDRFLFPPDRQHQPVNKLSGGEKRRLQLLQVLMQSPNILILDEPTNDLDTQTLFVLEEYLDEFKGAVIIVSHDRYFIDRTCDRLMVFTDKGQLMQLEGTYSDLADRILKLQPAENRASRDGNITDQYQKSQRVREKTKFSYKEQQEWDNIEAKIQDTEKKLTYLQKSYEQNSTDYEKLSQLQLEIDSCQLEHDQLMERWLELTEIKESF